MKLHAKYHKHGLSSFRQDFFYLSFAYTSLFKTSKQHHKEVIGATFFFNNLSLISLMEQFCQIILKLVVVSDK